jgi:hypothetical protein
MPRSVAVRGRTTPVDPPAGGRDDRDGPGADTPLSIAKGMTDHMGMVFL